MCSKSDDERQIDRPSSVIVERAIIGDVFFVRDWLLRRDRMIQGFRPTFVGRPVLVALMGLYQRREHLRS